MNKYRNIISILIRLRLQEEVERGGVCLIGWNK